MSAEHEHEHEHEAPGSPVQSADADDSIGLSMGDPILTPPEGGRFTDRTRALDAVLTDLRGEAREREQQLEALLFSTHVPLTPGEIARALGSSAEEVAAGIARLERALSERTSAVALFVREKSGERAFILDLKAAYRKDAAAVAPPMLKQAVTETLALIAINQPLSQSRLVRERGSTVYEHVKELMTRGLIQRQKKGRNFYLRTTDAFAGEFGLENDPELIRRALARAAGVERAPEVVGSPRVHLGENDVSPEALVAEALACVPPEPLPVIVSPESEAPVVEASAPEPESIEDVVEDCVVSGGEPPTVAVPEARVQERVVVKQAPEASESEHVAHVGSQHAATRDGAEGAAEAPPSRIAHLLSSFQDQATTDDW